MPNPRSVEEWAAHCSQGDHLELPVYPALCLDCARAYAQQQVRLGMAHVGACEEYSQQQVEAERKQASNLVRSANELDIDPLLKAVFSDLADAIDGGYTAIRART